MRLRYFSRSGFSSGFMEVAFIGEGGGQTACNTAEHLLLLKHRLSGETSAHIGIDGIRDAAAGAIGHRAHARDIDLGLAKSRGGIPCRIAEFGDLDEFGEHRSDMAGLPDAVVPCSHGCHTGEHITDGRLAAGIAVAVEQGEEQRADTAVIVLSTEEDPVPGHKDIIEDQV